MQHTDLCRLLLKASERHIWLSELWLAIMEAPRHSLPD